MTHIQYDLGPVPAGRVVRFNLSGSAANVMLLDAANYQSYRRGQSYRYVGGHATKSPVRLAVPHAGHWKAVVDLGGCSGTVNASVKVLGGAQ